MAEQSQLVLPPKELIYRVAGTSDSDWFVQSGQQSVRDIEAALASVGQTLAGHDRILDFGCGCGRIMLQLGDVIPLTSVTGVDIDQEAIAWLRPHAPRAAVLAINELPPMPFDEATFDLVYCHSVFTHLDSNYQDRWLEELRRVTKPGGLLVVSFSGKNALEALEQEWIKASADPAPMLQELRYEGILFIADDEWANGPFPDFYHSSFHSVEYVKKHWGDYFKILRHIPCGSLGFQDFVVMERTHAATPQHGSENRATLPLTSIPMPPPEFRVLVGPAGDEFYDNPTGELAFPDVPEYVYTSVFDFGSGCGLQARQLLQQKVRPSRYVGIDIHREMVAWCQTNLSALDYNFQFLHHNVYNPGLAPDNAKRTTAPFPVGAAEFTLVNAHSVFTHLDALQTQYYLREIARILTADGIARTTWLFLDRSGFPWLESWQNCLFVNADEFTNAAIHDWRWFLEAVFSAGLAVRQTEFPAIPGHQWQVLLEKRREGSVDHFPAEEAAAEWLCGVPAALRKRYLLDLESQAAALQSANRHLSAEIDDLRNSWSWRLTRVGRKLAHFLTNR